MAHSLSSLANPDRFLRVTGPLLLPLALATLACLVIGSVWALAYSPADARQGDTVRMMYVHVPAAWMAMGAYAGMAVASIVGYVWRHQLADLAARVAAPIGAAFTFLALVTGAIWGKVTWGVWWDWDPRLVSMLVLLFLYMGYMALWRAIDNEAKAARPAALLCIIGAVNLPIIKFSVDFWDSLHQTASVIRPDGPAMPASMLWPLLIMAMGFLLLHALYVTLRMRSELLSRKAVRHQNTPVSRVQMVRQPGVLTEGDPA